MPRSRDESGLDAYDAQVEAGLDRALDELAAMCRQRSTSSDGVGIPKMVALTLEALRAAGAEAHLIERPGVYPAAIGTWGRGDRSLLLYDHYDTQPAGEATAWRTPPFEPVRRDGRMYARGAADDKGEIVARLHAIRAYREAYGELPLRVTYLIEGEHEIGSPGLAAIVAAHRNRLTADGCLSEGLGRDEPGNFAVYLGCRGFAHLELTCATADRALASMYGGIAPNAAVRLARALATLFDNAGDLDVDGLAELVPPPTSEELAMLGRIPIDVERLRADLGVAHLLGHRQGVDLLQRYLLEPFGTVCALVSSDLDAGLALPGRATARLDVRLVPPLTPGDAVELVRRHLERRGLDDVGVLLLAGVHPDRAPRDSPIARAAIAAARDLDGRDPVLYPTMPAISAAHVFHETLGTPVIFAGAVSWGGSNMHGPNENLQIEDYRDYVRYLGRLLRRLSV